MPEGGAGLKSMAVIYCGDVVCGDVVCGAEQDLHDSLIIWQRCGLSTPAQR